LHKLYLSGISDELKYHVTVALTITTEICKARIIIVPSVLWRRKGVSHVQTSNFSHKAYICQAIVCMGSLRLSGKLFQTVWPDTPTLKHRSS